MTPKAKPTRRSRPTSIPAGEFKAQCLKLMDKVARDRTSIIVTKRGRPVVRVVPADETEVDLFGYLTGSIEILGDIISPIDVDWEAQR